MEQFSQPNSEDLSNFGTTIAVKLFISPVQYNKSIATQFHPEKSGKAGLSLIKYFYDSGCFILFLLVFFDKIFNLLKIKKYIQEKFHFLKDYL